MATNPTGISVECSAILLRSHPKAQGLSTINIYSIKNFPHYFRLQDECITHIFDETTYRHAEMAKKNNDRSGI
jgi:hypothetical protein